MPEVRRFQQVEVVSELDNGFDVEEVRLPRWGLERDPAYSSITAYFDSVQADRFPDNGR
jgi:hypothetical protein